MLKAFTGTGTALIIVYALTDIAPFFANKNAYQYTYMN
jgi:hypothetical protein